MDLKCARTTPELPKSMSAVRSFFLMPRIGLSWVHARTMRLPDLAPDNPDLRSTDLLGRAIHKCDALSKVPLCVCGCVDALKSEQADVGVGIALPSLVAEVLALHIHWSQLVILMSRKAIERTAVALFRHDGVLLWMSGLVLSIRDQYWGDSFVGSIGKTLVRKLGRS